MCPPSKARARRGATRRTSLHHPAAVSRRRPRQHLEAKIRNLGRPLLVLHAPGDEIVGIDNARQIFEAARHPKSFVSLDGADHLLTRHEDAAFVAEVVSAWYGRHLARSSNAEAAANHDGVLVRASGEGRFQQVVEAGRHRLLADEPVSYGGLDSGPSPYDFLSAALGACTSMTLQLYAERKGWQLPPYTVEVRHAKVHAEDCVNCAEGRAARSISSCGGSPLRLILGLR